MIRVRSLIDSSALVGDPVALRARWAEDGVIFLRDFMDADLIGWARSRFRDALAAEDLIDPASEAPVWTGQAPKTRRPCDALGTEVWHKVIEEPNLNAVVRDIFDDEPRWIPIVGHRSSMPTGPIKDGEDLFAGRHQDGYFNEGIEFLICWMPIRDTDQNSGSFAVAPGTHRNGNLHSTVDHRLHPGVIPDDAWRSADFRVGDVLIFHYHVAHATLPNPSDMIRMSLDVRAVPASGPQPVVGEVERVDGTDVSIVTAQGQRIVVHVSDRTYIRDMHPQPRVPTAELERIAFPGAHVMAMSAADGQATVMRRNFY